MLLAALLRRFTEGSGTGLSQGDWACGLVALSSETLSRDQVSKRCGCVSCLQILQFLLCLSVPLNFFFALLNYNRRSVVAWQLI